MAVVPTLGRGVKVEKSFRAGSQKSSEMAHVGLKENTGGHIPNMKDSSWSLNSPNYSLNPISNSMAKFCLYYYYIFFFAI